MMRGHVPRVVVHAAGMRSKKLNNNPQASSRASACRARGYSTETRYLMGYGMNAAIVEHREATEDDVYADAWRIADPGAVNPTAVAHTLAEASKVINRLGRGTDAVCQHPALRVIAGQLAMLHRVDRFGADSADYDAVSARVKALEAGQST
jgi:hypothetical protein